MKYNILLYILLFALFGCKDEGDPANYELPNIEVFIDGAKLKVEGQDYKLTNDNLPVSDRQKVAKLSAGEYKVQIISNVLKDIKLTDKGKPISINEQGIFNLEINAGETKEILFTLPDNGPFRIFAQGEAVSKPVPPVIDKVVDRKEKEEEKDSNANLTPPKPKIKYDTINIQYKGNPDYILKYIGNYTYEYILINPKQPTQVPPPPPPPPPAPKFEGVLSKQFSTSCQGGYIALSNKLELVPKRPIELSSFKIDSEKDGQLTLTLSSNGSILNSKRIEVYTGQQEVTIDDFLRLEPGKSYIFLLEGDVKVVDQSNCNRNRNHPHITINNNQSIFALKYNY